MKAQIVQGVTITLDRFCGLRGIPSPVATAIMDQLTMDNPKFLENEKRGRWNGNTDSVLRFYRRTEEGLVVPRGFARQTLSILRKSGVAYQIEDHRRTLTEMSFTFMASLTDIQRQACDKVLKLSQGTLTAPTGSGKTIMALSVVAERRQPTLIIVHTKELLEQWVKRVVAFLNIPKDAIGFIGAGKLHIGKEITIGTVQSLKKYDLAKHFGHVIVDECHHTPSSTFRDVITRFDSKYLLGLSATPYRRDGLTPLIYLFMGDEAHRIDKRDLLDTGAIVSFETVRKETCFKTSCNPTDEYSAMITELCEDPERNRLIVRDVEKEWRQGEVCLVLSDRKEHCRALAGLLSGRGIETGVLTGDVPTPYRRNIVDKLNAGTLRAVCGTTQLIGEGFDCKGLSVAFIATPIKFEGKLLQAIGRVLRPAPEKAQAKVYDYVDINVGVLRSSAASRNRIYQNRDGGADRA